MNGRHKFDAKQFDANMDALPEVAYALHMQDGSAILIKRGESGFYPLDTDKFPQALADPATFVAEMNEQMNVRPSQSEAMKMGSLFGWDVGGANPSAHKLHDLIFDLNSVDPALADRAKEMRRGGADYDTIFHHFKDLVGVAEICRTFKCDPADYDGWLAADRWCKEMLNEMTDDEAEHTGLILVFDADMRTWAINRIVDGELDKVFSVEPAIA